MWKRITLNSNIALTEIKKSGIGYYILCKVLGNMMQNARGYRETKIISHERETSIMLIRLIQNILYIRI